MKYKKAEVWLWILLVTILILFVLLFPKTCGKTDFVSKITDYQCKGISAPFINIKTIYSWCYGICFERSIEDSIENNLTNKNSLNSTNVTSVTSDLNLSPFSGIKQALVQKGPIILGILILIGILKLIANLKARKI